MSSSDRSLRRSQSVADLAFRLDGFEEEAPLHRAGFSRRDDASFSLALRVYDDDDLLPEEAERDPPVFAIVLPIIEILEHRAGEDRRGVAKIDPVLAHVLSILRIVPFELHRPGSSIVRRGRMYVNTYRACSLG